MLPAEAAVAEAQRLLDGGQAFAAHEVLEGAWKAAPDLERELWRGLAQLAVGVTHAQRGNLRGAAALLARAAERLRSWSAGHPGPAPAGLAVHEVAEWATALARCVEATAPTAADLVPQLRGRPCAEPTR